jgi:transcriptional regulator with XRE-family HTH domain
MFIGGIMNHSIGDKIKGLRSQRNISQESLAKALFFSNRTISNWEHGLRDVSIDNLQKIADYFQVPMTYFTSTGPTELALRGAYQQVKVKKIALSERFFYAILIFLVINTLMLWIPFSNRMNAALFFLLFWIGVLISAITRYSTLDRQRTKEYFVPHDAFLQYVSPLTDRARRFFKLSNVVQYFILSLLTTSFYVGVFGMMNLQNLDYVFNALVVVFYFFMTMFHLIILIQSLMLGTPRQHIPYSKNQNQFNMLFHRLIVSLHYFMVVFFIIYLNAFAYETFPLDLILFNLINGMALVILLRVILSSNAKFYDSYRLICEYSDHSRTEILV